MAADCVNLVAHSDNKPIKIVEWKVTPGSHVSTGLLLFLYEDIVDDCNDKITKKYKARNVGTLHKICAEPGSVVNNTRDILFEMTACTHPTVMRDLCAECGADLRHEMPHDTSEMASVSMIHSIPELKVSHEQAIQLGRADQRRLINSKKLVLLVDLDQTLVHTTNDDIPANIKDVYHFQLYGQASPWYHTRLRPGTRQFLRNVSELYELHICTFGARTYAHMIASILDSDGKYFANRILSRDECFNPVSKTGNLKALFPCGDSMVCIIDDREDVWNFTPNLVHVKPYHFFQHTGDINAPPGLDKTDYDSDEEEDNLLSRVIKTALNRKINDDKVPKKLLKKADVVAAAVDKVDGRTVETKENGFASSKKEEVEKSKEDRVSEQSESNEVSEGSPNSESVEKSPQVKESEKDSVTAPSIANSSEGTESPKVEESEKDSVTAPSIANSSEGTKSENGLKNEKRTNGKSAGDEARTKENASECDGFIEIEDNDDYLLYLEEILTHVHKAYFKMYEQLNKANKPDLRSVVPYVRMKVLRGTNIVFSGVIPTNLPMEKNRAYTVAKSLGASVQKNLVTPDSASDPSEVTTHLIAARSGTAKVNEAKRIKGMNIVSVDWLWSCSERWEHVEERLFPLKKTSSNRNSPVCRKSPFPADPIVQRNAAGNMAPGIKKNEIPRYDPVTGKRINRERRDERRQENFAASYNPLLAFSTDDIANMDKEVEDIFNEDSDASDEEIVDDKLVKIAVENGSSSSAESLSGERPHGWKRKSSDRWKEFVMKSGDDDEQPTQSSNDSDNESQSKYRRLDVIDQESDDSDFNESIGSADEEIAAAIERELLNS